MSPRRPSIKIWSSRQVGTCSASHRLGSHSEEKNRMRALNAEPTWLHLGSSLSLSNFIWDSEHRCQSQHLRPTPLPHPNLLPQL